MRDARRRAFLAVLAVGLVAFAGCTDLVTRDDPPGNDTTPPGDDGEEDCQSLTFGGEDEGSAAAARIECEADVPGTVEQDWPCRDPDGAEGTAATELEGGSIRVVVEDANDQRVVDERVFDTGGQPRNLTVEDGGVPGEWTLTVERSEGFDGSFTVEGYCPEA